MGVVKGRREFFESFSHPPDGLRSTLKVFSFPSNPNWEPGRNTRRIPWPESQVEHSSTTTSKFVLRLALEKSPEDDESNYVTYVYKDGCADGLQYMPSATE